MLKMSLRLSLLILLCLSTTVHARTARMNHFERVAKAAQQSGDIAAEGYLMRLGEGEPMLPPPLSAAAMAANKELASKYNGLLARLRWAFRNPVHPPEDQWRVDRTEADLHLAAWELNQDRMANITLVMKCLYDAWWSLDHHVAVNITEVLPPMALIEVSPRRIEKGKSAVVAWTTGNATEAWIDGETVALSGSREVTPPSGRTWKLIARGEGGEATSSTSIDVYVPAPTAAIDVNPKRIEKGTKALLTWSTNRATEAWIEGNKVALSGSEEVSPSASRSWQITARGEGGVATASTRIEVYNPWPQRWRIHFDFDESFIREDARDTMSSVARFMRAHPLAKMAVEGHADAKGSNEYNDVLGLRRAESVRDYFVATFGLDPARFLLVSKGEYEPIARNAKPDGSDDPDGRQYNRRAEFVEVK